jgi:hypothetical protein
MYLLVCGCDNQTYENWCFAAQNGASVQYMGECQGEPCTHPSIKSNHSVLLFLQVIVHAQTTLSAPPQIIVIFLRTPVSVAAHALVQEKHTWRQRREKKKETSCSRLTFSSSRASSYLLHDLQPRLWLRWQHLLERLCRKLERSERSLSRSLCRQEMI